MSKFDKILELDEILKADEYGEWIIDREHKGTRDDPIQFPYVLYTEAVMKLIEVVYEFHENNPEYGLNAYLRILEENGYKNIDLDNLDITNADDKCLMALLMWITRGERFCDGLILHALNSGAVFNIMERLKQISENE